MKETGRLRDGETGRRDITPPVPPDEGPPFGGSWRALYLVVLLWLAAQVVLFYLFTEAFR